MNFKRMFNIFGKNGRSLIVAMDHGSIMNVLPYLEKPGEKIERVLAGGADAIMTTVGIAKTYYREIGKAGLIVRLDGGVSSLATKKAPLRLLYSVEDALRLGADAVSCMGFPGSMFEDQTLHYMSKVASDCQKWNVGFMAEMLPRGFEGGADARSDESVALACRIGVEIGADFIKTDYTNNVEGFKKVVAATFKPVVVLGGGKKTTGYELLKMVDEALKAGAKGVAVGRNVWQQQKPEIITAALSKLIHDQVLLEEVLEDYQE